MAHSRKVDVAVWNDGGFRAFSRDARLLWLYLLTAPVQTSLGAFKGSIGSLAEDVGFTPAEVESALAEIGDRVALDRAARVVWVRGFLSYNRPSNGNMVKGWRTAFGLIPESPLLAEILAAARLVAAECGLVEVFDATFRTVRKPFPNGPETVPVTVPETVPEPLPNRSETVPATVPATVPEPSPNGFGITDQRSEIREKTHTAREGGAVPAEASTAGAPADAAELVPAAGNASRGVSLLVGGRHVSHAECGRVCFPAQLFAEYLETIGGDRAAADARLRGLIRAHMRTLPDVEAGPIAGASDAFRYWRRVALVEGWFGEPVPVVPAASLQGNRRRGWLERSRAVAASSPASADDVWGRVLTRLESSLNRHTFLTWFRDTRLLVDRGESLEIAVADASQGDWILRHYAKQLEAALSDVGREGVLLVFQAETPAALEA